VEARGSELDGRSFGAGDAAKRARRGLCLGAEVPACLGRISRRIAWAANWRIWHNDAISVRRGVHRAMWSTVKSRFTDEKKKSGTIKRRWTAGELRKGRGPKERKKDNRDRKGCNVPALYSKSAKVKVDHLTAGPGNLSL